MSRPATSSSVRLTPVNPVRRGDHRETMPVSLAMHRRCETVIRQLRLPLNFRAEDLLDRAHKLLGRPIELEPLPPGLVGVTGLVVDFRDRAYICVAPDIPAMYARHILAHELGHLVLDHRRITLPEGYPSVDLCGLRAHRSTAPLPRHYDHDFEAEAELFATLVLASPAPQSAMSEQWSVDRASLRRATKVLAPFPAASPPT